MQLNLILQTSDYFLSLVFPENNNETFIPSLLYPFRFLPSVATQFDATFCLTR